MICRFHTTHCAILHRICNFHDRLLDVLVQESVKDPKYCLARRRGTKCGASTSREERAEASLDGIFGALKQIRVGTILQVLSTQRSIQDRWYGIRADTRGRAFETAWNALRSGVGEAVTR